jgi:hypothetical protein
MVLGNKKVHFHIHYGSSKNHLGGNAGSEKLYILYCSFSKCAKQTNTPKGKTYAYQLCKSYPKKLTVLFIP